MLIDFRSHRRITVSWTFSPPSTGSRKILKRLAETARSWHLLVTALVPPVFTSSSHHRPCPTGFSFIGRFWCRVPVWHPGRLLAIQASSIIDWKVKSNFNLIFGILLYYPAHYAAIVAHHVNCSVDLSHQALMKCLREVPMRSLLSTPIRTPEFGNAFGPSVDGVVIGESPASIEVESFQ